MATLLYVLLSPRTACSSLRACILSLLPPTPTACHMAHMRTPHILRRTSLVVAEEREDRPDRPSIKQPLHTKLYPLTHPSQQLNVDTNACSQHAAAATQQQILFRSYQMIRVISSPSRSTTAFFTAIFFALSAVAVLVKLRVCVLATDQHVDRLAARPATRIIEPVALTLAMLVCLV